MPVAAPAGAAPKGVSVAGTAPSDSSDGAFIFGSLSRRRPARLKLFYSHYPAERNQTGIHFVAFIALKEKSSHCPRAMNASGSPTHKIAVLVSFGGTLPSVPLSLCSIFITMACVASSVFCRCHAKTASKHHGKLCRIRKSAVFCNLRAGIVRLNELLRGGVESCLD